MTTYFWSKKKMRNFHGADKDANRHVVEAATEDEATEKLRKEELAWGFESDGSYYFLSGDLYGPCPNYATAQEADSSLVLPILLSVTK